MDFSILKENPHPTCGFAKRHPCSEAMAFGPAACGRVCRTGRWHREPGDYHCSWMTGARS